MSSRCGSSVRAVGLVAIAGALGLAACGDSSTDPAQPFLGTWHYDPGASGLVTCEDGNTINLPPEGNKTFAPGLMGGVVDLSPSPLDRTVFCNFEYDVQSSVKLVARPDEQCTLTGGDNFTISSAENESATFTLNGPTIAEEIWVGTIHIIQAGAMVTDPAIMTTCTYNLIGHLTKVAKD